MLAYILRWNITFQNKQKMYVKHCAVKFDMEIVKLYNGTLVLISNLFWKMHQILKLMGTEKTMSFTMWPAISTGKNSKSWGRWHQQVVPCMSTTRSTMSVKTRFLLHNLLNTKSDEFWNSWVLRYDWTIPHLKNTDIPITPMFPINSLDLCISGSSW